MCQESLLYKAKISEMEWRQNMAKDACKLITQL